MHFKYRHGYAIPEYVDAEPKIPRGGVFRTKYARRRSYDNLSPGFSLGDDEGGDPIDAFGKEAARTVLVECAKLPPAERKRALKAAFDQIDPKLWGRADARATELRAQGMPPAPALEQALAEGFSLGLLEEFAKVGKKGEVGPMLGIGFYGPGKAMAGYSQAMGGIWSAITGAPGGIARSIGGFGSTIIGAVGSLACIAASAPGSTAAAGVAGGPAAAAGAQILAGRCGPGQQQVHYPPQQQSSMMPFLLIGGAVIAVILLTR